MYQHYFYWWLTLSWLSLSRVACYWKHLFISDIEGVHLHNSIMVQVSGSTQLIDVKYTRLKLRLFKIKFSQKKINLD